MNARLWWLLSALLLAPTAHAEEGDESKVRVSVRVLPARPVEPGTPVGIEGVAPLDARGLVAIRIINPDGVMSTLDVRAAPNGDYSAQFNATERPGTYRVGVGSPGGLASGSASFEVAVLEDVEVLDGAVTAAKAEAQAVAKVLDDIEADIDNQIPKLPDNPAKDELKQRFSELKPLLKQAARDFGKIDAVLAPIKSFAEGDAALKPLLRLPAQALEDWTKKTGDERKRIVNQLAASRRANVTCEQLERVIESFRFAGALAGALTEPFSLITDPFKEMAKNVGTQVGEGVVKRLALRIGLKPGKESALSARLTLLKDKFVAKVGESNLAAAKAIKGQDTLLGKLSEVAAWLAGKAFDRYCERFSGPFKAAMQAEFLNKNLTEKWWEYSIQIKGQLELRYAKGGVAGAATTVNGEFAGQATHFTFKEDAIRVGFPGLMAGAVLFKRALIPKPWLFGAPPPNEDKPLELEGKAAAVMVKPYGFSVPVQGELVDEVLTLRVGAAAHDYTATARVVYVIISPHSIVPVVTGFELPFKDAGFMLLRASKGEPLKLKVRRSGKNLSASDSFKNEKGNAVAKGKYQLDLKLCNPAGSC